MSKSLKLIKRKYFFHLSDILVLLKILYPSYYTGITNKYVLFKILTFAIKVLEQPGGPYINKPLGGLMLNFLKPSAYFTGHSTACCSCNLRSSIPPMSFQETLGTSTRISRIALGRIIFNALLNAFSTKLLFLEFPTK